MYKKILLAFDGSEHSKRAAEHAVAMASLVQDSSVEIINVIDIAKVKSEVLHQDLKKVRETTLEEVTEVFQKANVSFELKVVHGEPGTMIVSHVNEEKFDLVILGSRGLNAVQELVLGSVSHRAAVRAHCPVLIIK
ncbi:universal stress protein [Sporolactobacillus sp. STCC-11]|uniref:universal stress protein n=1 Tax=Sporolactobacillus caesalpiniae TaxID=3230362 RepID=UPI00339340F5